MKVCVVVSGGKIASIDIVENSDTPSYLSSASSLISTIISTQSTNVDTVSGATYSSLGSRRIVIVLIIILAVVSVVCIALDSSVCTGRPVHCRLT